MVLLYYIFKNPLDEKTKSACSDVEMSIEVFTAMGRHRVTKRCLELVSEVYELSKKVIRVQQEGLTLQSNLPVEDDAVFFANLIDPFLLEDYALNDLKLDGLMSGPSNAPYPGEGGNALESFLNFTANR